MLAFKKSLRQEAIYFRSIILQKLASCIEGENLLVLFDFGWFKHSANVALNTAKYKLSVSCIVRMRPLFFLGLGRQILIFLIVDIQDGRSL